MALARFQRSMFLTTNSRAATLKGSAVIQGSEIKEEVSQFIDTFGENTQNSLLEEIEKLVEQYDDAAIKNEHSRAAEILAKLNGFKQRLKDQINQMEALIAASQNLQNLFPFHFTLEDKQDSDEQALAAEKDKMGEGRSSCVLLIDLINLNRSLNAEGSQLKDNIALFLDDLKKARTFNPVGVQAATKAFEEAKAIIDEVRSNPQEVNKIINNQRLILLNSYLYNVNHPFAGLSSVSRGILSITGIALLIAGMYCTIFGIVFTAHAVTAGPILLGIGLSALAVAIGILARLALRHDIDARPATKNISNMVGKLSDGKHALLFQHIKPQEFKVDNSQTTGLEQGAVSLSA